ncbi:hypothetical protein HK104_007515, partial [Borealophlyctis nickersoniae]
MGDHAFFKFVMDQLEPYADRIPHLKAYMNVARRGAMSGGYVKVNQTIDVGISTERDQIKYRLVNVVTQYNIPRDEGSDEHTAAVKYLTSGALPKLTEDPAADPNDSLGMCSNPNFLY